MEKKDEKNVKMNKAEEIYLNRDLYNIDAIKESIKDFNKLLSAEIKEEKRHFKITIKPKINSEDIKKEFCNYVLGVMKNRILV